MRQKIGQIVFHFLGQDLFSKDFFTKENHHYLLLIARVQVWLLRCWSLFQGLSITFNALKAPFTRQVDSHSNLGTFWNSRETVSFSSLFLRNIQVFCSLILKCKPHKRRLPSFPAFACLMEVQGDVLSANLRGCGVCNISFRCEEFFTTHPHFQVKFRLQTGCVGRVARDKNITGF